MEDLKTGLNKLLADLNVFYRKLQNYHWNVKGKEFFVIHAKLEEYYDKISEQIDEVAEHLLTIGGQPLGTLQDYLNVTNITEAKNEKITADILLTQVKKDYAYLLEEIKNIKEKSDEQSEYATSALMDDYIKEYSKILWMLSVQ